MGADAAHVHFGVRFLLNESEVESFDYHTDERIRRAKQHKLDYWDGSFATADGAGEQFLLLIGKNLVRLGYEDSFEFTCEPDALSRLEAEYCERLSSAGFAETPRWFFLFEPDY